MDTAAASRDSKLPPLRRIDDYNRLRSKLNEYMSPAELEAVDSAYDYSARVHAGQNRRTGDPYITHPVAVADVLTEFRLDAATMQAALLHDVVEDTAGTLDEIRTQRELSGSASLEEVFLKLVAADVRREDLSWIG